MLMKSSKNKKILTWEDWYELIVCENLNYLGLKPSNNLRMIWSSLVLMTLLTGFDAFFINNNIFKNNEILQGLTVFCSSIFFFYFPRIIAQTDSSCFTLEIIEVILLSMVKPKIWTWSYFIGVKRNLIFINVLWIKAISEGINWISLN